MSACPECGASWEGDVTCQEAFHQMLFWENEQPPLGVVHNLAVLCYHLQHPNLYSPDGLRYALGLLHDFVEKGLTTEQARRRGRAPMDSGTRSFKITAAPGAHGQYPRPVPWRMHAVEVTAAGPTAYIETTRAWAQTMLADLRAAGIDLTHSAE